MLVNKEKLTRIIHQIGGDNWTTLTLLATYMDKSRRASPTQEELARVSGLSRQAIHQRIQTLSRCMVDGKPLIRIHTRTGYANEYDILTDVFLFEDEVLTDEVGDLIE
jgi:transcriptional regulator with XRE-family HTH domain